MHIATQEDHYNFVKLLIKHNAKVNLKTQVTITTTCLLPVIYWSNLIIQNDWTPLHVAAQDDRSDIAELLIDNGADIEAKTKVCIFIKLQQGSLL